MSGCGVCMPFPALVVGVGVDPPPITPIQTLTSAHIPEQSLLTVRFYSTKSTREIFW